MNVTIIGCGARGALWAQAAESLGLTIAVCADTSERRAQRLAKVHGATAVRSAAEAFRRKSLDVAIIATPTPAHAAHVVATAKAGKHILCEAPFTRTLKQAREAAAAVRRADVTCYVAHAAHAAPEMRAIHHQLAAGKIGPVGFIRTQRTRPIPRGVGRWYRDYAQSGGVVLDGLSHDFEWIASQFGAVKKVFCQSLQRPNLDFAMATLTLETGAIVQAIGSWSNVPGVVERMQVEVCGSAGIIQFDSDQTPLKVHGYGGRASTSSPTASTQEERHLRAFLNAIGNSNDSTTSAVQAMKVAEAALKSAHTTKAVKL